jgi:endonuclease/exonuclease/phosphatase family metal-dependent hydrolase
MRIQKSLSLLLLMILVFNVFGLNSAETGTVDTLKILTYNVRNCKGLDNLIDYERIANVIKRIDADVVALQELDSVTVRSNHVDVLAELARKTGLFPTYRASIKFQGGAYGIGILTRIKPLKTEALPLPGKEEKRSVLLVELPGFVVCCTHFSLTSQDRAESVGIINQLVTKYTNLFFWPEISMLI